MLPKRGDGAWDCGKCVVLKVEDLEHWQAGGAQMILGQHGKTAPVEKQMREVGTATRDGRNAVVRRGCSRPGRAFLGSAHHAPSLTHRKEIQLRRRSKRVSRSKDVGCFALHIVALTFTAASAQVQRCEAAAFRDGRRDRAGGFSAA